MPDLEVIEVAGLNEPLETTESIVLPGYKKMAWLTEPSETADLIVLKGIIANDPGSDDRCAICRVPYGTPNEDGTTEYALRFPCGHDVGNVCMRERHWCEEALLRSGCFLCRKSVVPARYVQEQVKEIWAILKEMSPGDIYDETETRGSLSRAIEPLRRYVGGGETAPFRGLGGGCAAASLRRYVEGGEGRASSPKHLEKYQDGLAPNIEWLMRYHEDLAPCFEWLLIATWDFLFAVRIYVENTDWANSRWMSLEAIKRRKCEVELSYENFQTVVRDAAMMDTALNRPGVEAPNPDIREKH